MFSPIVSDFVKIYSFAPLIDSNSFGTEDYDAPINLKTDFSISQVFKSQPFKNWIQYIMSFDHKEDICSLI